MACKKGMPGRSADDYGVPTISADDSTPSNCSFECVEKSHAHDQALHFDCGVASRRPSFLPDAHELCGHFHGSLDGAWGDLTSACGAQSTPPQSKGACDEINVRTGRTNSDPVPRRGHSRQPSSGSAAEQLVWGAHVLPQQQGTQHRRADRGYWGWCSVG